MFFCGQCGLQLAPNITRCPRCGATVDPNAQQGGNAHADDQTVASPSLSNQLGQHPSQPGTQGPFTPPNQQRLVLGSDSGGNHEYGTQGAFDATSRMGSTSNPVSNVPPVNPNYYPQSGGNYQGYYPQQGFQSGNAYQTQNPSSLQSFATPDAAQYAQQQEQVQREQAQAKRISQGKATGLVLILIGLLCVLGAIVLFIVHGSSSQGSSTTSGSAIILPASQRTAALVSPLNVNLHGTSFYTQAGWQFRIQPAAL
ncbi:MAG TPA: zinc ribbon domain-containing protein [Ktedonobacteraceae bacterium]|nr:zinc ribbon domain-containing protein [Ktedonobacteraceae bacterium]